MRTKLYIFGTLAAQLFTENETVESPCSKRKGFGSSPEPVNR